MPIKDFSNQDFIAMWTHCDIEERKFLTWVVQHGTPYAIELPKDVPMLDALRDYADKVCLNEEQWRLLLVLEDPRLVKDNPALPGNLFRHFWRHPAQVACLSKPSELENLLDCSKFTAYSLYGICSRFQDRRLSTAWESLQRPPMSAYLADLSAVCWCKEAWQVDLPALLPDSLPLVAAWSSFEPEKLAQQVSMCTDHVFPKEHGLVANQVPCSHRLAIRAWAAACDTVNRIYRYMEFCNIKETAKGSPISTAVDKLLEANTPQWYEHGVLPRTHIQDWENRQVSTSTLAAEAASIYHLPEFVLRAGKQGKALSACDMTMGSLLLWQGQLGDNPPSWVKRTLTIYTPDCVVVGALDILGIYNKKYAKCPAHVVKRVQHAINKVMLYNRARGMTYSLLGNAIYTWAFEMDTVKQQILIAGPWALSDEQPTVCQVTAAITQLAVNAEETRMQQQCSASHPRLQKKVQLSTEMTTDMPTSTSTAEQAQRTEISHSLPALQAACAHELPCTACIGDSVDSTTGSYHVTRNTASKYWLRQDKKRNENPKKRHRTVAKDQVEKLAAAAEAIKLGQVLEVIGHGTSGYTFSYRAPEAASSGSTLWALKIAPVKSELSKRLRQAGTMMRKLPGIAPDVVALGPNLEGAYVMATKQLIGCATYSKTLPPSDVECVTRAVQRMHEAGVIHGNLRAEHILITAEGEVRLVGFGGSFMDNTQDTQKCEIERLEALLGVANHSDTIA